ncbi:hypothetical protein INR49_029913 [Caranx melampygus]|nr:hypothetical protein INR49_029913 [Caranx melampygus]
MLRGCSISQSVVSTIRELPLERLKRKLDTPLTPLEKSAWVLLTYDLKFWPSGKPSKRSTSQKP